MGRGFDLFIGCLLFVLGGAGTGWAVGLWYGRRHPVYWVLDDEFDRGYERAASDAWQWREPDEPPVESRRHTILLEPGPTIYPALAELAQDAMGEPESHPDATTSTWLMERRLWMEDRYPIPVGAP